MVFQSRIINRVLDKLVRDSDIRTRPHLCSRVRYPRSECRICQTVCPMKAVKISGESLMLDDSCSGCEICIAACPNGVFTLSGRKEKERRERLKKGLRSDPVARLTCSMDKEKDYDKHMVVPCLASLSEAYLIAPLAWGGERVQIKRIDCKDCPFAAAMTQYDRILERARRLLVCFDVSEQRIEEVDRFDPSVEAPHGSDKPRQEAVDRREFFDLFRRRTVEATMTLMPDAEVNPGELRWSHEEDPHRSFLLKLLSELGEVRESRLSCRDICAVDLEVSETCIGCKVCSTLCPSGAIRREVREGEGIRLLFNLSKCTGCGICEQACHPRAISFSETIDLRELISRGERELIFVSPKSCRLCGRLFQGILGDTCPECFDALRRNR